MSDHSEGESLAAPDIAALDNLWQSGPVTLFRQTADRRVTFITSNVERLTGLSAQVWRDRSDLIWTLICKGESGGYDTFIKKCAVASSGLSTSFRLRHQRSGRVIHISEYRLGLYAHGRLVGFDGIWQDVTRQKQMENRLLMAGWKETISELTRAAGHDFNNLLAGVISLSETYLDQLNENDAFYEGLDLINKRSQQAVEVVGQIMSLHRAKQGELMFFDVNTVLSETLAFVQRKFPNRITISAEFTDKPLSVYGDPISFQEILIGLLNNSTEAIRGRGRICCRTSLRRESPTLSHLEGVLPAPPAVVVEISDTGSGMNPATLAQACCPFFTTKLAPGSGLGLWRARAFVSRHRGAIGFESAEGIGTTVSLWLSEATFTDGENNAVEACAVGVVLLLSDSAERGIEFGNALRDAGSIVVDAEQATEAAIILNSDDYVVGSILVIVETSGSSLLPFVAAIRREKPAVKVVVQLLAPPDEDLRALFEPNADVVLLGGMSEPTLERLARTFGS